MYMHCLCLYLYVLLCCSGWSNLIEFIVARLQHNKKNPVNTQPSSWVFLLISKTVTLVKRDKPRYEVRSQLILDKHTESSLGLWMFSCQHLKNSHWICKKKFIVKHAVTEFLKFCFVCAPSISFFEWCAIWNWQWLIVLQLYIVGSLINRQLICPTAWSSDS